MKNISVHRISALIVTVLLLIGCSSFAGVEPRSEEQLVELYQKYHAAEDLDKLMELFYQDGTPDFILDLQRSLLSDDFGLKIKDADIQDISEEEKANSVKGFPYEGKTLVVNLEPLKKMDVTYDTEGQGDSMVTGVTLTIGKDQDTHYFILTKFKEEN